jgi:hypothetical protein
MRYLMIQFIRKPNGQIDEHVQVSRKIKKSDESTKNVILDYGTREVIKCVIEGKNHVTTFEIMSDYYKGIYPTLIKQLEKEGPIEKKSK